MEDSIFKKKLNITLLFIHRLQRYETEIVIVIVIESASEMIDPLMEWQNESKIIRRTFNS